MASWPCGLVGYREVLRSSSRRHGELNIPDIDLLQARVKRGTISTTPKRLDHEALWGWLRELNIPYIELLQALCKADYGADLHYGSSTSDASHDGPVNTHLMNARTVTTPLHHFLPYVHIP